MANYVAWYGKKREHLIEHERRFVTLLRTDVDASKAAAAAEQVRAAQVRALKSKRAELAPSEKNSAAIDDLDREITFWLALSAEEVINGYRTGELRGHRSTVVRNQKG